jgi:predicted  nucleic acid-binding Zn-ribbon protein
VDHVCHRCGTALNSSDELFCPHCGAPQLRYELTDEPGPSVSSRSQTISGGNVDAVSWKAAVVSAVLVAIPVGLLASLLDFGWLWVIGGGIATMSLYRRRVGIPPSSLVGLRIGVLLGVLTAFVSTAFYSVKLLALRYLLHSGELDQQVHSVAQQLTDQVNHSDPQTAAAMTQLAHLLTSPDGTAVIVLTSAGSSAVFMVLLAAVAGALSARIASLGNRPERSSH